jgi:two-component system sensor kinase
LGEFLDALGDASRPVLLLLDDCQWADELTCKLIGRWQKSEAETQLEPRYVTVVAAWRSEEASRDHIFQKIRPAAHLQLSPLSADDVRRLAESMAGPLPDEAAEVLVRLSGGSPFMASAVLRGLVESGALAPSPSGWRIEPLALDHLQSSNHAAAFLARRIELLPPATVNLLSVGAVLGKEFDLKIAAHLCEQSASETIDAADEARQRRLVWLGPDGGQCVFVHDKIRAALLERLSPTIAAAFTGARPCTCSKKGRSSIPIWRITSTPPATPTAPCPTRCERPRPRGPNTRSRLRSNNTGLRSVGLRTPIGPRGSALPKDWATC